MCGQENNLKSQPWSHLGNIYSTVAVISFTNPQVTLISLTYTRIFKQPCKKCDMGSHFSWKFHVISRHKSTAVWPKSTSNSKTISCHLSRFHLIFMLKRDMDFGQVHVMEFPWHLLRKWWDFHRIWSHFRTKPNCHQRHEKHPEFHDFVSKCHGNCMTTSMSWSGMENK